MRDLYNLIEKLMTNNQNYLL